MKSCSNYLTNLLNSVRGKYADLMLVPGVGIHKCLLAQLSPLLASLLSTMESNELLTMVLPQVEFVTVQKMVELVYTGR
jgi:hypothetical protein